MLGDIIYNVPKERGFSLSINDGATIIIAVVNLCLAFYIFVYQTNKDKRADKSTAILNEKNINLQWFKDIIIQPHFQILINNFEELINLASPQVSPSDPQYDDKVNAYLKIVKSKIYLVRKNFLSLFEVADVTLFKAAVAAIDKLIEKLTKRLIDNRIDLTKPGIYEDQIVKEFINSKNDLIKIIYSFKG